MKRIHFFNLLCMLCAGIFLSCQKEISIDTTLASGSLHDSTGDCYPITVKGTYYNGINAARDTNKVILYVNVSSPGEYAITSTTENGFHFSDTGYFSKVGLDSISLQAIGTPTSITQTNFTVSYNQTTCTFTVNVADSTGTGLSGSNPGTNNGNNYIDPSPATTNTWHFTDSATGIFYSGILPVNNGVLDADEFFITGTTIGADSAFGIVLYLPDHTIKTGIYMIDENSGLALDNAADEDIEYYYADDISAAEGTSNSYINVTSYNTTSKVITGSFHAWAKNISGVSVLLKGSFNTTLQ